MVAWHEKRPARAGLRLAGLALLGAAWMEGARLQKMIAANPLADASPLQVGLAALLFASASAGILLAFVGAGLWKPVTVSDRWATNMPVPPSRHRALPIVEAGAVP